MIRKLFSAFFLLAVLGAAAAAQTNPEQSLINARDQFSDIKNRSIELERMKREAGKRPMSENVTLKFPEIKEDFEQIQKLNAEIFRLTEIETPTNRAALFKLVSEINRRAARLRSNLFPSESKLPKEKKNQRKSGAETPDVKALLGALDKSIDAFVHNSIFQNLNLVNSEDLLKAQKELEVIIAAGNAIKAKTKN